MSVLGALAAAMGRARRVPRVGFTRLTTKQGPRTYYKGKGAASTGHHTNKGAGLGAAMWGRAAALAVGARLGCESPRPGLHLQIRLSQLLTQPALR